MTKTFKISCIAALGVAALLATNASAATLTRIGDANDVNAAQGIATPGFSLDGSFDTVSGSSSGQYRDVYEGTSGAGSDYFNLVANSSPGSLTLDLVSVSNRFEFLWGSADTYNTLTFLLGGVEQATYTGADLGDDSSTTAGGADFVRIGNLTYDSVQFSTGQNAFEFANVSVAPVPLPASGLLLLCALGAGGLAARRRKSAA